MVVFSCSSCSRDPWLLKHRGENFVGEGLNGVHRKAPHETLGLSVRSVPALAEISRAL